VQRVFEVLDTAASPPFFLAILLVSASPAAAVEPELLAQQPVPPAAVVPSPGTASATDAATVAASESDWPCVQARIDKIDAAAVWDGPPIEGDTGDADDEAMSRLVKTSLNRRLPMAEVETAIVTYARSLPEAERDAKLTKLFSGMLQTANAQRSGVISGIERYQKRQRANAKDIEAQGAKIAELESKAPSDLTQPTPELDAAREKYDWFARVFQERQSNLPIACEIPTLIEQRVFAVARAIRAQMKS
jgi:hypothetical protein